MFDAWHFVFEGWLSCGGSPCETLGESGKVC